VAGHGVISVLIRLFTALLLVLACASVSVAGPFRKTTKTDSATHVPLLLQVLRGSPDERARESAANSLREYDAKTFPEILPALTESLTTDKSPSVRSEAAESIGKIRPISIQAGYALEQAIANDKSPLVQLAAREARLKYRLLGIVTTKADLATQTAEPPLAAATDEKTSAAATLLRPTPSPIPVTGPVAPPPLAPKSLSPAGPSAQALAPKQSPQTEEPPIADTSKPGLALTSEPKKTTPVITIPSSPSEIITPIPNVTRPDPVGPTPMPLPAGLDKPAEKPAKPTDDGPKLPPPPK